jgi:2'-hydroxyisoflavone reductase
LYTSSVSVYYPFLNDNINEDQELRLKEPEGIEDEELKLEYWYSVMKANSEIAAQTIFGKDRTIIVRPTYIIGPGDKSNRFIYWPIRLSKGGDTLVPGKAIDPVQYIDVRDVAEWTIRLIEDRNTDTFNAVGPKQGQNIHDFIEEAKSAFDVKTNLVQVDDYGFLKKHNIHYIVPWILPEVNNKGSATISIKKGVENGLTFRPLMDTIKDTHEWWYSDALTQEKRDDYELKPNSILLNEKEILADWKSWQKANNKTV